MNKHPRLWLLHRAGVSLLGSQPESGNQGPKSNRPTPSPSQEGNRSTLSPNSPTPQLPNSPTPQLPNSPTP
ncbi:MAG: hypothetical protein AAGD25_00120 [Cyanobacteria bacterium P01_F01_bin.150]